MRQTIHVLSSCLAAAAATIPSWAEPPLEMAYDDGTVVVSQLEPGAEVAGFTLSRYTRNLVPFNERRDDVWIDDDGDGVVRIPLPAPVPPKTVLAAVELASGRYGVWTPAESPGREVALPAQALAGSRGGGFERLEFRSSYFELLLVRPGEGSWALTTGDGTAADESPASDGWVFTRPRSMSPVGEAGEAPEAFKAGDLLFGVSPVTMDYFAVRITP